MPRSAGPLGGDGTELGGTVEVDGAYFGGHARPENRKEDRTDRRGIENPRRLVVVVARERQGRARPWVVGREADGVHPIRQNVASGTEVHADEAAGWNILHASYPMKRVNHSYEYKSEEVASTNGRKATSPGCAARKWVSTTGLAGTGSKPTPTKWRGAKTIAAKRTARIGT